MKVLFLCLLFLCASVNAYGEECPAHYVTNDLDTVSCKINLVKNPFYKNIYHFHRISERVPIIKDDSTQQIFKPHEIVGFEIITPANDTCKFISMQADNRFFYHEIVTGKISVYKRYMTHPYDKGQIIEFAFYKNDQLFNMSFMSTRRKKIVRALFEDNPRILAKWDASKFSYDFLLELVKEYNDSYTD